MCAFPVIPAIVPICNDPVDFFPLALSNIPDPQIIIQPVKAPAPGITKAIGIYLRAVGASDTLITEVRCIGFEQIACRNGVWNAAVYIDTCECAE